MIENAEVWQLRKQLERSALTPDQISDLIHRYKDERQDRERWYVDWNGLDASKQVLTDMHRHDLMHELVLSAKDKNLTKMFYHSSRKYENARHYLDDSVTRPSLRRRENLRVAHHLLRKLLHTDNKLIPIILTDINMIEGLWSNKDASAGAIGRGSKIQFKDDCFSIAMNIKERISKGEHPSQIWIPAVEFHRSQLGNLVDHRDDGKAFYTHSPKMKDRLIWGVDGATVTIEAQYAQPLIKHLSTFWFGYSGGDNPIVQRKKVYDASKKNYWMSIDFSLFDQTVQDWVIEEAFSLLFEFFDRKYWPELKWIKYNFINTWLLYSGGNIMQKHRGIPSGSNFTQIVGSICNAYMILSFLSSRAPKDASFDDRVRYVERELMVSSDGVDIKSKYKLSMFVMGDDNLVFTRTKIDPVVLSKYVDKVFGVKIHPEKTDAGKFNEFPWYLKRQWRIGGEYRDVLELLINYIHPEHEREYDTYSPWHILYGLYLTYRYAFKGLTEKYFLVKMQENGGIEHLRSLKAKEAPGAFRAWGDKYGEYLYIHAKASLDL